LEYLGWRGNQYWRARLRTRTGNPEIIGGEYVAQSYEPPAFSVQLDETRHYQGQTTNMRTPGGGPHAPTISACQRWHLPEDLTYSVPYPLSILTEDAA
jgi:hypothetical protein